MNLLMRLLKTLALASVGAPLEVLGLSTVHFRVWPNDLDLNAHMNNGRYLTLMDLGRMDLIVRGGLMRLVLKHRWQPLVGAATIRFRRSLKPFQRYSLTTRVVGWDEKWFFLEQQFLQGDQLAAQAYVQVLFRSHGRGREGNVAPAQALEALGKTLPSPELPAPLRSWLKSVSPLRAA